MRIGLFILGAFAVAAALPAVAEVVEADEHGFVSAHEVRIAADPDRVFEALISDVSRWWDSSHTFSGDAANLSFDCIVALALCESWGESDENFVLHLRVDAVLPERRRLVLSGGLGPLQPLGVAGSMTFDAEAHESGTLLRYRYIVHGRHVGDWAVPVDRVQLGQIMRLKRFVETGSPVPVEREAAQEDE